MEKTKWKSEYYFLLANAVGIGAYLYFASRVWAPPGEQGLADPAGDVVAWMLTAFPILAACSLMNVAWFIKILLDMRKRKGLDLISIWALIVIMWVIVNRYDLHHHYVG